MSVMKSARRDCNLNAIHKDAFAARARALCGALLAITIPVAHASLLPGWTPPLTIHNVIVEDGDAVLVINGGVPTAYLRDDCNTSQLLYIDLGKDPSAKQKLAVAMTAYTTGQAVQLALQACYFGYPRVTHISLGSGL